MFRRAVILAGLLAMAPALAQAGILMMVENVIGPAKTTGYTGWFNLESLNWSIDRSKVSEPNDVVATLVSSATVATLIQLSASGVFMKKIVFDSVRPVGSDVALLLDSRLTCEEPIIRASSISADSDDRAIVQLNIRCGRLAWEQYDYNSATKAVLAVAKGSWNFKTNTP